VTIRFIGKILFKKLKYGSFERWKLPKFNLFEKKFSMGYKLTKHISFRETEMRELLPISVSIYLFQIRTGKLLV